MATILTDLELDTETAERVLKIASVRKLTLQGVVREAVEQYIELENSREKMWNDAEAAYRSYKETGLHLGEDEVREWSRALVGGEQAKLPPCHR